MYGKLRTDKIRRRDSLRRWAITLASAVITFALLVVSHDRGIPKKWVTATVGTLGPFSLVLYASRRLLPRWSFWTALAICFALHVIAIWILFQYTFADFQDINIWLWFPVMLIEAFVLLIAVKRIAEKLTGKHERVKLSL